jgi:alkylhydroperoxidase/carboxymuconolactone decarboxylase family protein YurZ
MASNERARKNHDELFPGHVSTLAVTDPELIETFDNFTFDEVLRGSKLDDRTRLMVQLAAMIASPALREYRVMVGAALTVGVTPVEIKEIVYQAVPYVGMAKVFDFVHATSEALTERGVRLPLPGQSIHHAEDPHGCRARSAEAGDRRRARRGAPRRRLGRSHAHPAATDGELLRRSCGPQRCRSADAGAPDGRDARRARRVRGAAEGSCRRQPQRRQ